MTDQPGPAALVKRLRDRGVCSLAHNSCRNDFVCEEAANRIEELEAKLAQAVEALTEIKDISRASQGPAAQFYGMLANKALTELGEGDDQE